jgi:hypothetical protein
MSPTFAASGFVREKRRVRAPEGSRVEIWVFVMRATGSGHFLRGEGGARRTFIWLEWESDPVEWRY